MNIDGGSFDSDNSWTYTARLPAVIPPARPPIAVPVWRRFALPHWRLILVATLASCIGIMSATLRPFQTKLGAVGHPSPDRDAASYSTMPSPATDTASYSAMPSPAGDAASYSAMPSPAGDAASYATVPTDSVAPPSTTIRTSTAPSTGIDGDVCHAGFPSAQLVVSGPPTVLPAESSAALGLTADGAADGAYVVICGFAAKSVFSTGRSIDERTWTMPVSEVADATLIPPMGFVGPMKLVVALVNADNSLADRRALHLQWLPQISGMPEMPRIAEVNEQLDEGKRLKAAGNLFGARAIFLRLAQNGDSRAAFLLAETYDPIALAKHQLLPPESDLEKARIWYRRASEHGSPEANGRLERLSNW
jgi:hypothetical protein